MNYNQFAKENNLKKIRESKGITQISLAGVNCQSESQISRYERGITMPRYDVLRAIARFLEVEIEDIYPCIKEIDERVDKAKKDILEKLSQRQNLKNKAYDCRGTTSI